MMDVVFEGKDSPGKPPYRQNPRPDGLEKDFILTSNTVGHSKLLHDGLQPFLNPSPLFGNSGLNVRFTSF
jgi:hypothetical protein